MQTKIVNLSRIKVTGGLDSRLRLGLSHLLTEQRRILDFTGWGGDQYGRWIPAVAMTVFYTGEGNYRVDDVFEVFLKTQQPNGMFGEGIPTNAPYNPQIWWGAGRALIGLLEYWELTQEQKALESARKLGDFYLSDYPFQGAGTNHQQGIEGLVALWKATGGEQYLSFAEKIFKTVDPEFGEPLGGAHGHHTHGYLSILRGLIDLFEATHKPEYLQFARRSWEHILQRNMWVTGGISEGSTYAFEDRDEGCSVADWLRFCFRLWQVTREPRYMDVAEHTLLNHLYFDQDANGGFCTYRSLLDEPSGQQPDAVAWWCCSMHGQRALLDALMFLYTYNETGIDVNLFADSDVQIPFKNGAPVQLRQRTDYPSFVRLEVHPECETSLALRVKIPQWTRAFELKVNGSPFGQEQEHGYIEIERLWKPGDVIDLRLAPTFRIIPEGANSFEPQQVPAEMKPGDRMKRAAIRYGPWVLMIDRILNPQLPEAPRFEVVVPLNEKGEPFLKKLTEEPSLRGTYAVSNACSSTLGRGVSDQESELSHEPSLKTVYLVPVSELTDRRGNLTGFYKVRNDVWWLDEGHYGRLVR
ncbi:glycoside hydrolase family 127 protein [Candidatus Poribacteria bacterium]|nr:glycoside hydrolase family 127 protein [Candidatus Poribacteria bacterium]